jgi:hypothetical protein
MLRHGSFSFKSVENRVALREIPSVHARRSDHMIRHDHDRPETKLVGGISISVMLRGHVFALRGRSNVGYHDHA